MVLDFEELLIDESKDVFDTSVAGTSGLGGAFLLPRTTFLEPKFKN